MQPAQKQGSALLVTLLVTSLLVALVLAFSAVVRIELRQVQSRIESMRARQNARLAIELAIAQLQTHAGVDQRATARADIQGESGTAAKWTGVWARDPAGGVFPSPIWLVSGEAPTPASPGTFEIFPSLNGSAAVQVPKEPIVGQNGEILGEFAFWVSDEGVKASVLARRAGVKTFTGPLAADRSLVEYQVDFGVNLSELFTPPSPGSAFDGILQNPMFSSMLERVTYRDEFYLVPDADGNSLQDENELLPFHDITTLALGVLENPMTGGLKKNLSDLTYRDGFLATNETAKFLDPNKSDVLQIEYGDPPAGIQPGDPYFSPRPILTEAALYMGLYHFSRRPDPGGRRSDGKIRTRYHMEAEILNPYSLPMNLDIGRFGPMTLLVRNLPTVTVQDLSGRAPSVSVDLDLTFNDFFQSRTSDVGYFCALEYSDTGSPYLLPGEVFQSLGPNQSQGLARNLSDTIWSGANEPLDSAQIRITGVHGDEPLIFELVHPSYSYDPAFRDAPRIQTVTLGRSSFPYTDFDIVKTFNGSGNPFTRFGSSGSYNDETERNMAYHFRLWSDETDPGSMRDLLTSIPFMSHQVEMSGDFENIDGNMVNYDTIMIPDELNPTLSARSLNAFDAQDVFMDNTRNRHTDNANSEDFRKMILIDVPTDDVLSTGVLKSLPLYRKPLGIIGSPWGGEHNKAFDLYYFSPKRTHPDTGDTFLVSPALTHWSGLGSPEASPEPMPDANDAEHEMVVGQFNINSTSAAAWLAVLSAPVLINGNEVLGAFFRMPLEVANTGNAAQTLADSQMVDNAFRLGGRALQSDVALSILDDLSQEIVRRIRSNGKPFSDLKEFVNSGILQDALNTVEADYGSGNQGINEGVMSFSNLYLTQNDLLTRLAPTISPRSDTFVIRGYGDVRGSSPNDILSSASCEVVVQRIPAKLDGSSPGTPANSLLNSRSFRIVSFRWLTDEDS